MGHNRSALLAGLILVYGGLSGAQAVALVRAKRQGALYNKTFAAYLQALPSLADGMPAAVAAVETSLVS
jgi:protein-tyrosine phosphatase